MGHAVGVATYSTKLCTPAAEIATAQAQPEVLLEIARGAVTQALRFNLPRGVLLETQRVLTCRQLLLPSFDFLVPCKGIRPEDRVHDLCQLPRALIHILNTTGEAVHLDRRVVVVGFGLGGDGELGHLLRGLVAFDPLARALDIEDQRVASCRGVEGRVATLACAAAVEAVETDIETAGVVLSSSQSRVLHRPLELAGVFSQLSRSTAYSPRGTQTA
jgi:hypothetical protein